MIKAVFFDFYNTLVRFWPPVENTQALVCAEFGIVLDKDSIKHGYVKADQLFNEENANYPLASRTDNEREQFFASYEQVILKGAGTDVSLQLAAKVWKRVSQVPKSLALFDDVIPALQDLKHRGLTLAVISNLRQNMEIIFRELALTSYVDFYVTSKEVGAEKPHPPIFEVAMERAHIRPHEGIHVGDQYQSDVLGARNVGLCSVLLDREELNEQVKQCPLIKSLVEISDFLIEDHW